MSLMRLRKLSRRRRRDNMGKPHGLKHESDALWEKLGDAGEAKKDMNANTILKRMGGGITMKDGSGGGKDMGDKEEHKAPKVAHPTTEVDVAGGDLEKSPKSKSAKAKAGEMGGSAKGGAEKMSKMAQKGVRKGY
jgi:hypothetical protein